MWKVNMTEVPKNTGAVENQHRSKAELLGNFMLVRNKLVSNLSGLKRTDWEEPYFGDWTLRDIVGHIIVWDFQSLEDAKRLLAGRQIATGHLVDQDTFNKRVLNEIRNWDVGSLPGRLRESSKKVLKFIQKTPEQELLAPRGQRLYGQSATVGWMLDYSDHDLEHLEQISEWRAKKEKEANE